MNVSVSGCLSLRASPVLVPSSVQCVTFFSSSVRWDWLQSNPHNPNSQGKIDAHRLHTFFVLLLIGKCKQGLTNIHQKELLSLLQSDRTACLIPLIVICLFVCLCV